ncbi:MAG: tetratricopeptide repeat protein, partial [Aridibacter famidurans]|nr:tetratricopeptide repeat protein [Aridibacter famidurans]
DPFWDRTTAQSFYEFLSERDRLLEYGAELKQRFRKDPSDFDTAVRLAHFRNYRYERASPVIVELEKHKKEWTGEELLTAARLLLADEEGELASRFFYTVLNREDAKRDKKLRARVIYQLFEIFSDAASERLSLPGAGLGVYTDMASIDTDPGISSGLLSMIFSDTDPKARFDEKAAGADELFNREAAYRLFSIYKQEFGTTPQMAQMYLDLIRLYTNSGEEKLAYELLGEFEQRHENSSEYPAVAMRLAAAFESRGDNDEAALIYRRVLDVTGSKAQQDAPAGTPPKAGFPGIRLPERNEGDRSRQEYEYGYDGKYRDVFEAEESGIPYWYALERLVEMHTRGGEQEQILRLYSEEIGKYPDREWLYEQRLKWLEQTNLRDTEAEVYKAAADRFKTHRWRDKLARFLLRNGRQRELKEFGERLSGSLGDAELEAFLTDVAVSGAGTQEIRKAVLEKLYLSALKRFPANTGFASGLLALYAAPEDEEKWLELAGNYFFISEPIRAQFLDRIASKQKLRSYLEQANGNSDAYELFRAEANARLSRFEDSYAGFAGLSDRHPSRADLKSKALQLARSLGQTHREKLETAADMSEDLASLDLSLDQWKVVSGEIAAELGDFKRASGNWEPIITAAKGRNEAYLEVATIYWDYFQFQEAKNTIERLRDRTGRPRLYAFEVGAILDNEGDREGAIREYVKALEASGDEDNGRDKSVKRLADLSRRSAEAARSIADEYSRRKAAAERPGSIVLAYAEVLEGSGRRDESNDLLYREIRSSRDREFLRDALDHFYWKDNSTGQQAVYRRLIEVEENPRTLMDSHFRLAESLRESGEMPEARTVVRSLAARYPANYGVVTEASRFLVYTGFGSDAAEILNRGLLRARGKYRLRLARMLASTQVDIGRLDEASELLSRLHTEFGNDPDIFRALATVLVRQNRPEALRKAFQRTADSLSRGDRERIYVRQEMYELRKEMVEAFTILNDPHSAVDQYIEIINRNPLDTGRLVEMAVAYAKRYGVTERLVEYYAKLTKESYKNHRWNLVLARLYESRGELEKASVELNNALATSPGMPETHLHLSDIEFRRGRTSEALEHLDRAIELEGETDEKLRKKISILETAGKQKEAEEIRKRMSKDAEPASGFDEAARIEDAKAASALFKKAFDALLSEPIRSAVDRNDLTLYAKSIRDAESLERANSDLWELRARYVSIAEATDSTSAGKARERLRLVDSVIGPAVGEMARQRADDKELASLYSFLKQKIDGLSADPDKHGTLSLVIDISKRAGFGVLEERLLRNSIGSAGTEAERTSAILSLGEFYISRGAFRKLSKAYTEFGLEDYKERAEAARLAGDAKGELDLLRKHYFDRGSAPSNANDPYISRFLEILHSKNKEALSELAGKSSAYQIQTINFLLGKGEKALVHKAIEFAEMPEAWKLSRHSEVSLALGETGESAECYFCRALDLDSIGKMIAAEPDKASFLVGDDWFRLARKYGEWLETSAVPDDSYRLLLPAMTENRPSDASEQFSLGLHYLKKGDPEAAIDHLRPASEMAKDNARYKALLGAALLRSGATSEADEILRELEPDTDAGSAVAYIWALAESGLRERAKREAAKLLPHFASDGDVSAESLAELFRISASVFTDESERAEFYKRACDELDNPATAIRLILNDSLVGESFKPDFLRRLIRVSERGSDADYWFETTTRNLRIGKLEAETVYDQRVDYENVSEPGTDRYVAQRQLFDILSRLGRYPEAREAADQIAADLDGRFARPAWLKLGLIDIDIRERRYDPRFSRLFIGIADGGYALAETKAPNVERLNDVVRLLEKERMEAEAAGLRRDFYARMLAVGEYDLSNLEGLARALFALQESGEAVRLLSVTASVFDPSRSAEALRDLDQLPSVRGLLPLNRPQNKFPASGPEQMLRGLASAAAVAEEFSMHGEALRYRRVIAKANPADSSNQAGLADLLLATGSNEQARAIWERLVNDRFALRPVRWTSLSRLSASGAAPEWSVVEYDPYSLQFAGSLENVKGDTSAAITHFSGALLTDPDSQEGTRRKLVALYARTGRAFAALRLAETLERPCDEELCKSLSASAESVGELGRAIAFEESSGSGDPNRVESLKKALRRKETRYTEFTVDLENVSRQ